MKLFIIALVTLAVLSSPILTFACPPPPAPGYDGGASGDGPLPGTDDHTGGDATEGGSDTSDGASSQDDVVTGVECM
ncbi:MAG: hypothetical protein FD180_3379 [Planctomycetota bacterium]|nr:MAG: hypothetical protein FD180_3379 [Planctomycetota bacterium]